MKQVGIAISQLLNACTGGMADESFSSRNWRLRHKKPFTQIRPVIDGFFFVVTLGRARNHCEKSHESEVKRKQFPEELQ